MLKAGLIAGGLLFSGAVWASADCQVETRANWINEKVFKKQLEESGYKIKTFKIDGNCYELYGKDKDGKRVEIYFNPITGQPVKMIKKD